MKMGALIRNVLTINTVNALQFFQLLRYGSVILVNILLAKSSLALEEIASYEWLLYIGTIASFFWINALLQSLLPVYPKLEVEVKSRFFFNAYLLFCLLSVVIGCVFYFLQSLLIPMLTDRSMLLYYDLFLVFLIFNLPTSLIEYFLLLKERSKWIIGYGIASFGLYVFAVIAPVYLGFGLEWSIWLIAGLAMLKFICLSGLTLKWSNLTVDPKLIRSIVILALPLVFYTFMAGFANIFDSWLVGWFYESDKPFVWFRYGARELPMSLALVAGLSSAMIPLITDQQQQGLEKLREKSTRIYHWVFPLSIILLLTSQWWFPLVFSSAFTESIAVFDVFLLLVISRVVVPYPILMANQESFVILLISIAELLVNVLLSFIFIRYWGLVGVALATMIAFAFEKIVMAIFLWWKYNCSPRSYINFSWWGTYSLVLGLVYLAKQFY